MTKAMLLWLSVLLLAVRGQAQPSAAVVANLQRAIVRIESGGKVGTGFLWRNRNSVVTTMHLIANRSQIEVTLHDGIRRARVVKALRDHDLVLLELDNSASVANTTLTTTNTTPILHSSLYTVGYNGNGNLNTLIDRSLRLGFSSNGRLAGLLSPELQQELQTCRMPNPTIQILYLEGTLLPGFSGAPIVDTAGNLVGIADGGLDKGASSISWGVRAAQLPNLEASTEALATSLNCAGGGQVRFAADRPLDERNLQVIQAGRSTFVKTKTRTIAQMQHTIDDPAGLQQLLNVYALNNSFDYRTFSYDVYEDLRSGAAICVPEGSIPVLQNDMLEVSFARQQMAFVAWLTSIPSPDNNPLLRYNPSATAFQQKIIARDGGSLFYQFDPSSSYQSPLIRADGVIANRISYAGIKQTPTGSGQASFARQTFSFQTLVGRGAYFLGAAALNDAYTDENISLTNRCVLSGQCRAATPDPSCVSTCKRVELYAQLVLGVHMVGFSNSQASASN
ncbi:serine protease [Hymenobacter sp. YC55]|uniref:S1 family peptidase n=1 Tax=Hymenobacter sp. YC55 TaxID=3034019 RepID=UPI0023F93AE1|nr:serine protease [Hymenobacter sp. YC55]MDF7815147.1 serine protease [Hymenobacter sp. YC55]